MIPNWGPLQLFWYISYNRWMAEAIYNVIAEVADGIFRTDVGARYAGVDLGRKWFARDMMIIVRFSRVVSADLHRPDLDRSRLAHGSVRRPSLCGCEEAGCKLALQSLQPRLALV